MKADASKILALLRHKHEKDVFIPECKNGPTQTAGAEHLRMDAWVMARSWSRPLVTAYEIKVTRADFLADKKWHGYLPYCNEFYFAAAQGVIDPSELPPEAGLMVIAKTGTRLFVKKAAPRRDVNIPESLWRYIVMCRAEIGEGADYSLDRPTRVKRWKDWLAERADSQSLGYRVSAKVREHVAAVEAENRKLKRENQSFDRIRERIREMGLDPDEQSSEWKVRKQIDELTGRLPQSIGQSIKRAIDDLQRCEAEILRITNRDGEAA